MKRALLVILLASGCAAPIPAPITDRSRAQPGPNQPFWTAHKGDTLYSIAWDSGVDHRDLAAWNQLEPPYRIQIGQKLRLSPGAPLRRDSGAPAAAAVEPAQEIRKAPDTPGVTGAAVGQGGLWRWPAEGKIARRFDPGAQRKGIEIGGNVGSAVTAAAPGSVVYEGSGLRGYGHLIIVKHEGEFLSAYAHLARTLVREHDVVRSGQKIAEMGSSGSSGGILHFEIRQRGLPVDPLLILPRR